ncbi:hypothetical protein KKH15_00615 [Patescibacteria group bacterium]|nr:hypothetical protein [Patescibacteria group bacterium]MBU1755172.1 hypothetical protein [Patescibacteria group bacterium]
MKKLLLSTFLAFFILAPSAQAANLPILNPDFAIVPTQCSACPCGFAGTLQLVQNLVNASISVAFILLILIITYAGALFLFSPTNPGNREMGRTVLTNAVIGMVIVLSSWLVVDFIMKSLYNPDATIGNTTKLGPWNEIIGGTGEWCIVGKTTRSIYSGEELGSTSGLGVVSGGVTGTAGCPTCRSISGVSCTNANSCTLNPATADRIESLAKNYSGTFVVTEAYPPSRTHKAACHNDGTCIDAAFRPATYDSKNVISFVKAADNQGLRAVFETVDCKLRDAVRAAGYKAYCRDDGGGYEAISGTHFSVYSN